MTSRGGHRKPRPTRLPRLAAPVAPLVLLLAGCSTPSTNGSGSDADPSPVVSDPVPVEREADLLDVGGSVLGQVTARQSVTDTGTEIQVQASGLAEGEHPLTLLDTADCTVTDGVFSPAGEELEGAELAGLVVEANGLGEVTAQVGVDLGEVVLGDGSALLVGPPVTSPDDEPTGSALACATLGG